MIVELVRGQLLAIAMRFTFEPLDVRVQAAAFFDDLAADPFAAGLRDHLLVPRHNNPRSRAGKVWN